MCNEALLVLAVRQSQVMAMRRLGLEDGQTTALGLAGFALVSVK